MLVLLSFVLACALLTHGAAPVISDPAVGQLTLKRDQNSDMRLYELQVQDADNETFTCQVDSVAPPTDIFQAENRTGDNGYWVYFIYQGPGTVTRDSYSLNLMCTDGTETSNVVQVRVDIINVPPRLTIDYSSAIPVDISTTFEPQNLHVIGVQDADGDPLTCTSLPPAGFSVTDNCVIKNTIDLRSLTASSETITVRVSDGVNSPVTFTVSFTFTNLNQPPSFEPHAMEIFQPENVAGAVIMTFSAADTDVIEMTWQVDPSAGRSLFDLQSTGGTVRLAAGKAFDFEGAVTRYVVTCLATDRFLTSSSSVTISALNVNEAPYFLGVPVQVTVSEGPANTVSVLPQYSTVDPDGDVLTYQIVSGGTYSNLFSIRTSDGTLTNQQALERDNSAPNPVTIKVAVSDPGKLTATADVLVHLTDINDNAPAFNQTSYSFKVGLSSANGDWVGAVGVTDVDAGNNQRTDLVMTSSNPSGYFKLEPEGSLFLIKDLDVGYGTVFTLTIKATDNGSPMLTSTSVITITWYSGPNIVSLPAVAYCHEDLQAKTKLHDLNVVDTVTTQFVCVKDESLSTSTKAFDVISSETGKYAVVYTGAVSLAAAADVSTYDVAVRCYDRNGQVTKVLRVDVIRNSAPLCIGSSSLRVDASATNAGDVIYTIQATDVDNDTLTFSVVSALFYVGTYSGVLRAAQTLRYVTADDHLVSVTVKDTKHTSYCSVVIQFTNINKVPVFSNLGHTLEVPEDIAAGSSLYTITVTDLTVFTPNIDMTWTSADKNKFALGLSGLQATLRLAPGQKLDYESGKQTYTVTFTASDGYLTSEPATLTIVVTPVNEPPYFAGGLSYYAEFEEISSKIAVLGCNIRDPDAGDTVTLSLSGSSASLFSVQDLDNCQVTLKSEYDLDTGASSTVTLTLLATDSGGLTATATLVVHIVEINDNTPKFAGPVTLVMDYGMRAADFIGSVAAVDIDLGTNGAIYYSVLKEPANPDLADTYISFLSNGSFIVRQSMDNVITTAEKFQYVILAADGGAPQRTSSTTVNILYDPFLTTTTTTVATTSTTEVTSTTEASANTSLLNQPLFIGLLAAVIGLAVIVTAGVIIALLKHFNANKSFKAMKEDTGRESPTPRRSSTPVRPNRISVYGMENQFADGRKISRMVQMPVPSVY